MMLLQNVYIDYGFCKTTVSDGLRIEAVDGENSKMKDHPPTRDV